MSEVAFVVVSVCEYWLRIAISLQSCVKEALLDILHDPAIKGLPRDEQQLFQRLCHFKQHHENALKKIIKPFQWDKMCHFCSTNCPTPCPRQGKTSSNDLDISCIVILITNLTALQPPQGGWKNPNKKDQSKAAYVLFARQLRNEVNHCAVEDISTQQEFSVYWQRVEQVLIGLQFRDMNLFYDLKTTSLDAKSSERIAVLADQINTLKSDVITQDKKSTCDVSYFHTVIKDIKTQLTELQANKGLLKAYHPHIKELHENLESIEVNMQSMARRLSDVERKIEEYDVILSYHQTNQKEKISQLEDNSHTVQKDTSSCKKNMKKLSETLKDSVEQRFIDVFVTFEKSTLHIPKGSKREDIVVGLSLIKDAEKAFFQAAETGEEEYSRKLEVGIHRKTPIIERMRNQLQEVSSDETNYKDIITSSTDYVIISGAPGCGKSTLCETLAYNWACNKLWFKSPNFPFVFLLRFRELNRFKKNPNITAEKILANFYPDHFSNIAAMNEDTLLILDGFDECFSKYDLLQPEKKYTSYTYSLSDLLNPHNKKLPYARIITSRPASCPILFKLLKSRHYTKARLFEITGFNMENIEKYVRQYNNMEQQTSSNGKVIDECQHSRREQVESFLSEVKQSTVLRCMMTIPFYCNGVCCLMLDGEVGIESIPMTYTGLFTNLLTLFLRNHGLRDSNLTLSEVLEKETTKPMILILSKFAFLLEIGGKITFTEQDFNKISAEFGKDFNFDDLIKQTGLIIKLRNEKEPLYQFLHYSFHEFFLALHLFHNGETSDNHYILPIICGLAGGLVEKSKSNCFVQKYAKMFQSDTPIDVQQLLQGVSFDRLLANLFEYQNKFHAMENYNIHLVNSSFKDSHVKHLLRIAMCNDVKIDSFMITTTNRKKYGNNELLLAIQKASVYTHLFLFNTQPIAQVELFKDLYVDKLTLDPRNNNKDMNFIDFISLFSSYAKEIHCFARIEEICNNTNTEHFVDDYQPSIKNVELTIFLGMFEFNEGMKDYSASWKNMIVNICKVFSRVNVALYKHHDFLNQPPLHNESCITSKYIKDVTAISKSHSDIKNLSFTAACAKLDYHNVDLFARLYKVDNFDFTFLNL